MPKSTQLTKGNLTNIKVPNICQASLLSLELQYETNCLLFWSLNFNVDIEIKH